MNKYPMGSISHGTMRAEDLIPEFADVLRSLDKDKTFTALINEADDLEDFDNEDTDEILSDLFDALNNFAAPYFYFGAHPGDGSDYGFWLSDSLEFDFDGLKVSDTSEVPDDYVGEVLHVSDHGNPTLYAKDEGSTELREIWALV